MKLNEFLNESQYEGFHAQPYYSPESDTLTFFEKDREHYAERVDSLLTVFLDVETGELVGCKIKGVRRVLDVLSKFNILNSKVLIDEQADVPLGSFFLAGLTLTDKECRVYYERCGEASKGILLKREEFQLASQ